MTIRIKMRVLYLCVCVLGPFLVSLGRGQSVDDLETKEEPVDSDELNVVTETEKKMWNVTANLFKRASIPELGIFMFSPLSLTSSMVMVNAGAGRTNTTQEIQSLFQFLPNSDFTVKDHTEVLNSLKNQSDVILVMTSGIYANIQRAKFQEKYVTAVSSLGEVETLDFTDPEAFITKINDRLKNQTKGKVSQVVEKRDFNDKSAVILLLNTLYFKAPWKQQFNQNDTETADFHVSDGEIVQVEMMHISAELPNAELNDVEATAVFLPYKGDRINMIIYLPWQRKSLTTLEAKLESLVPNQVRNKATTSKISLHLPKFNISSSLDFKEILKSLGVQKMFGEGATFRRMTVPHGVHVAKVRQTVFIEVNEEGGDAAVPDATDNLADSTPKNIRVDRPFIFQIYDRVTGAILLSGRFSNPNYRVVVRDGSLNLNWDISANSTDFADRFSTFNIIMTTIAMITIIVIIIVVVGLIFAVRARKYHDRTLVPSSRIKA